MDMNEGRSLENAFLRLVAESDPKTVSALLGVGESTVYRQSRIVRNGGELGGPLRKRVHAYVYGSAGAVLEEGGKPGGAEATVGEAGMGGVDSADDVVVMPKLVDWGVEDITEARRLLRQELHGDDGLQLREAPKDSPMARAARLLGVVPDAEIMDHAESYGEEVSILLTYRALSLPVPERDKASGGIFSVYENHVHGLVYLEDMAKLRRLEFRLVDEYEITLPPYEAPLDDMQRIDVLEDLDRQIASLEREIPRTRADLFLGDCFATLAWWVIRVCYPLPRAYAVENRLATYLVAGDAPEGDEQNTLRTRWRKLCFALGRRRQVNRVLRPYQAAIYQLYDLEDLLECMRLERLLVRQFGFRLRHAAGSGEYASVADLREVESVENRIKHLRRIVAIVALPVSLWWWLCRLWFHTLVPRRLFNRS